MKNGNMKSDDFDRLLDIMDELCDATDGYYPTVEEMEDHHVKEEINSYLVLLAYMASDPFRRAEIEPDDTEEYKASVSYCRNLLYQYEPA